MLIRREVAFVSCFLGLSVAACGNLLDKLKGGSDAGTDAGVVSASGIENESAITRYPSEEVAVSGEAKTLRAAVVHSTFPGTDIVATIPVDTSVIEMATHAGGVLIVFEQAGSKKMGWIDATVVPAIASEAPEEVDATTAPNKVVVVNRDAGSKVDAGKVDAGSAVVDAGKAVVDAGKATDGGLKLGTLKIDAGGGGGTAAVRIVKPLPASGTCEGGYTRFPTDGQDCRKLCSTAAECGGAKCIEKGSKKTKMCYSQ